MIQQPDYATKSRNPNIKPKWKQTPGITIRLPKKYHKIAWSVCQAIDQDLITEAQLKQWLKNAISNPEPPKEEVKNITVYRVQRKKN
ncbi:hypothetical protein BI308_23215 [Roseofilum reptotaenium AO1-A]|uniref:Uncharacterized protein n=1 Tax=Roseofilum reptotaenium AO1-A TaxID=1925591 RepID=A0A1L9QKN3_9CYAN|nr:hypothetical protein BI308_23215 [Roseofilum reptotaenium AO1-A]